MPESLLRSWPPLPRWVRQVTGCGAKTAQIRHVRDAADGPGKQVAAAWLPGAPRRVGPPGPQPGASAAGRGGAQRSRLDPIRLNSAVCRANCCGLVSHAAAATHGRVFGQVPVDDDRGQSRSGRRKQFSPDQPGGDSVSTSMRTSAKLVYAGRSGRSPSASRRSWLAPGDGVAVLIRYTASGCDHPNCVSFRDSSLAGDVQRSGSCQHGDLDASRAGRKSRVAVGCGPPCFLKGHVRAQPVRRFRAEGAVK
jgi:hypothetical protein